MIRYVVCLLFLGCAPVMPARDGYVLPFGDAESHTLLQGYNGPYGHTGKLAFAYDFKMPIGTAVAAARGGVIAKVESRYADANRTPGQENYVVVSHGDGTFARYYHLTKDGALVSVGQRVSRGEIIGRSGDTGASAGPHLHFDVTRDCAEWGCQTVAMSFRNAPENPLVAGKKYQAGG